MTSTGALIYQVYKVLSLGVPQDSVKVEFHHQKIDLKPSECTRGQVGAAKGVIINDIHEHSYKHNTIWAEHDRTFYWNCSIA